MFKRLLAKGNMHRSDRLRALVTDTIPGDIPIVISNDGFYGNMRSREKGPADPFLSAMFGGPRSYTRPYRYNIMRPGSSARRLSLLHPTAQLAVCDFYQRFGNLICYYSRKSPASIRSPRKIGSTFFVRGSISDKNKIKGQSIDTVDIENSISNPASYFSYNGYSRAFKFFNSPDYLRLEKRFPIMYTADVSKCFGSIYTHTLYWAIADVHTAKENTGSQTFSNAFDKLMQSMNYNETNGICVGPEVSRVFAELILSEVDKRVVSRLSNLGVSHRSSYEFRRYVDDYYLFAVDDATASKVIAALSASLNDFNLHLNEKKTNRIERPFVTLKSRSVRDADESLESFFSRFLDYDTDGGIRYLYPKGIRKSGRLLSFLVDSIKSNCFDRASGYELVSNYVIGALASRIDGLVSGYSLGAKRPGVSDDDYVSSLTLLLEAIYFFYNVFPSVPSSLKVAQAAIQSANLISTKLPDRLPFLAEQIVRWTFQFVRSLDGSTQHRDEECVPLEALNILLVLGEVGRTEALAQQSISEFCDTINGPQYFEIVSFLFCMRDEPAYADLRLRLLDHARALIFDGLGVKIDAQAAHLALDLLACPHLPQPDRVALYQDLRAHLDLPPASGADAAIVVSEFEAAPWFVDWREVNLLRMIRKKELSGVY